MWKVTISASSWRRWRSESANIDMSFLGWRGEGTLVNGAAEAAGGGHYTHQAGVWPSLPTPWGAPHERTAPPEGAAPLRGRERGSDLASVAGGVHGARLHGLVDVLQAGRIVDGGGHAELLAVGDVAQQLAQDLAGTGLGQAIHHQHLLEADRKSTRLNSSHVRISYAVFCLKKKKKKVTYNRSRENDGCRLVSGGPFVRLQTLVQCCFRRFLFGTVAVVTVQHVVHDMQKRGI